MRSCVIHLTTENVEVETLSHFADHLDNVRACHSWNLRCSCDQLIIHEVSMKAYKNMYKFSFLEIFWVRICTYVSALLIDTETVLVCEFLFF